MKQTQIIMGMPITVEIVDKHASKEIFDKVFDYFHQVDEKFSTYKSGSEISQINRGKIGPAEFSDEMKEVFALSEQTKKETSGFFDITTPDGTIDPSGLVKGWAIYNAAKILQKENLNDFYVDAGGDIQVSGQNSSGKPWSVGIKNPFNQEEIVKVVYLKNEGMATSGTYIRGQHIYNPHKKGQNIKEIVSLTVIGPNVYEADRFATAAFAQGREGIMFIENLPGFEAYMIDKDGIGLETSGFGKYTVLK